MRAGLPELATAERAEEFFEALGLCYEPSVVAIHRTALLRRLGAALAAVEAAGPADDALVREALRRTLREAHDAIVRGEVPPPVWTRGLVQLRRAPPGG